MAAIWSGGGEEGGGGVEEGRDEEMQCRYLPFFLRQEPRVYLAVVPELHLLL